MRALNVLLGVLLLTGAAQAETWDTTCRGEDCFRFGWVTQDTVSGFRLEAFCKGADCRHAGWMSVDNCGSRFDVDCYDGSCFEKGWHSEEVRGRTIRHNEDVVCGRDGCLVDGWKVTDARTGEKGRVTCRMGDCSRFGGKSKWRGRRSITVCKQQDCYRYGWTVTFLDPPTERCGS